ncbi:MAG TPA: Crp/Fnr family transcriptional regulator [Chitinophagaceae bacterium]|nr:Crp/Fnr family transcriptional regulator [Chitinophagaceae bacterium]
MIQLLEYLQAANPMSPELEQEVRMALKVRDLPKGRHWLRMGEVCNHILFIETGLMKSYTDIGNKEVTIWFHREFDAVISVKSFFKRTPSAIAIKTLEPTRIWFAEYNDLQRIYQRHPSFNVNGRVITEEYYTLSEDHVRLLHLAPRERYHELLQLFPWIEGRIRDKEMAAYLGISAAALSLIKRDKY